MPSKRISESFNVINISYHSEHDSDHRVRETGDLHGIAVPTTVRACRANTYHLVSPFSLVDVVISQESDTTLMYAAPRNAAVGWSARF